MIYYYWMVRFMLEIKQIHKLTDNVNLSAILSLNDAIILTLIGGLIPAKMANKNDPVEALRTE